MCDLGKIWEGIKNMNWEKIVLISLAIVILYYFYQLALLMLVHATDPNDTFWSRRIFIYSGIEAIVFGAAGFLFGREVNRQQAAFAQELVREVYRKGLNVGMVYKLNRGTNGWEVINAKTNKLVLSIEDNMIITYTDSKGEKSVKTVNADTDHEVLIQAVV